MITEVSPNIGLQSRRPRRAMEENEYYTDPITLTAETGEGAQSSPRERILANFRVLARTNLVLRGAATERER